MKGAAVEIHMLSEDPFSVRVSTIDSGLRKLLVTSNLAGDDKGLEKLMAVTP